jgi:hypothetical protein
MGQVDGTDLHPVSSRIVDNRGRRIEAHGLGVEERRVELRSVVVLQVARGVDEQGETGRMALGKSVVGERCQVLEDLLGHVRRHPVPPQSVDQVLLDLPHLAV